MAKAAESSQYNRIATHSKNLNTMPNVARINVQITTGNRSGAGTNGRLYLGLGGREFRLDDPNDNDLERGDFDIFIIGGPGANNTNPANTNDPNSHLQFTEIDVARFPRYLRFEGQTETDNWDLEFIWVSIYDASSTLLANYYRPGLGGGGHLWFGGRNSEIMYF